MKKSIASGFAVMGVAAAIIVPLSYAAQGQETRAERSASTISQSTDRATHDRVPNAARSCSRSALWNSMRRWKKTELAELSGRRVASHASPHPSDRKNS